MSTKIMKRSGVKPQRIVCGQVSVSGGTPSVAQGSDFTVTDDAAGKVGIVLSHPGKKLISAVATPIENTDATGYSAKIMGVPAASGFQVGLYAADATDGVLADNISFFFQAILED